MTTPQFISYLERRLQECGVREKVIPPDEVLRDEAENRIKLECRTAVGLSIADVLRDLSAKIAEAEISSIDFSGLNSAVGKI